MTSSFPGRSAGQISGRMIAIIVGILFLAGAAYLFLRVEPEPEPVPAPAAERTTPLETVAPAKTAEELGSSARDIIADLKTDPAGVDLAEAHRRAGEFQQDGRLADAQLLLFFAARGGYAPASFDLATMYDPNHFSPATSLMDKPDPFQAYKWYRESRDAGNTEAGGRLDELRAWADSAAGAGDAQAERLLLQWE